LEENEASNSDSAVASNDCPPNSGKYPLKAMRCEITVEGRPVALRNAFASDSHVAPIFGGFSGERADCKIDDDSEEKWRAALQEARSTRTWAKSGLQPIRDQPERFRSAR